MPQMPDSLMVARAKGDVNPTILTLYECPDTKKLVATNRLPRPFSPFSSSMMRRVGRKTIQVTASEVKNELVRVGRCESCDSQVFTVPVTAASIVDKKLKEFACVTCGGRVKVLSDLHVNMGDYGVRYNPKDQISLKEDDPVPVRNSDNDPVNALWGAPVEVGTDTDLDSSPLAPQHSLSMYEGDDGVNNEESPANEDEDADSYEEPDRDQSDENDDVGPEDDESDDESGDGEPEDDADTDDHDYAPEDDSDRDDSEVSASSAIAKIEARGRRVTAGEDDDDSDDESDDESDDDEDDVNDDDDDEYNEDLDDDDEEGDDEPEEDEGYDAMASTSRGGRHLRVDTFELLAKDLKGTAELGVLKFDDDTAGVFASTSRGYLPLLLLESKRASESNRPLFKDETLLTKAFAAVVASDGFEVNPDSLRDFGAKAWIFKVPVDDVVSKRISMGITSATAALSDERASLNKDVRQCLSIAGLEVMKNLKTDRPNPLRASFIKALNGVGVRDAANLVDKVFASDGQAFLETVISAALDLQGKPLTVRNEMAKYVAHASVLPVEVQASKTSGERLADALASGSVYVSAMEKEEVAQDERTTVTAGDGMGGTGRYTSLVRGAMRAGHSRVA